MFREEAGNIGLLCPQLKFFAGILLNDFNLARERLTALFATGLLYSNPTDTNESDSDDCKSELLHCLVHRASVLLM